ncbi:MAG: hypothetical protein ABI823_00450 [Bryobacteraceae bacterium]
MIKYFFAWLALVLALSSDLPAQSSSDLASRVSELERKMRLLDPSFGSSVLPADLALRIQALEAKMDALLGARTVVAAPQPVASQPLAMDTPSGAPVRPQQALVPVSITGDFQNAANGETRLPVAGYMDMHFNKDRGDAFRPDFHRFVLLFGHSFSDRIKFWSELEVEHALVEGGEESGEVALEQAYLDFLVKPYLNFRAGMMLTPMGIVNERHEPPAFNGVERPFVETVIIPTTWREIGFGLTGDLGRGLRYRAYLGSSLDASRFGAEFGISEGRTSGFDASFRNPAKMARLEYAGVRRLTLGTSFYSGHAGFRTPGINPRVTIGEFDGRYSFRRLDLRGLFAQTWITRTAELNQFLERRTGRNPNVARQMRGYYLEPAVHLLPRRIGKDLIYFARYEKYNTQYRMAAEFVPLSQFDRSSWVTGLTFKPTPDVALKLDYVFNSNKSAVVRAIDGINLGIGWWF